MVITLEKQLVAVQLLQLVISLPKKNGSSCFIYSRCVTVFSQQEGGKDLPPSWVVLSFKQLNVLSPYRLLLAYRNIELNKGWHTGVS